MFITKKALPRRTFLKGAGAALALPLLDAMIPAATALAQTAAQPLRRFGAVYVPHGAIPELWTPTTVGADFDFTPILKPLEPFRQYLTVVSGTGNTTSDGNHGPGPNCFLSGRPGKLTETADIELGVTLDQVIARQIGQTTTFPSLEVATEDFSGFVGGCDTGWACAYLNTFSWADSKTPLPMEINPRAVFERMFGGTGTLEERVTRMRVGRSILDSVASEVATLRSRLGSSDRERLGTYLNDVREIERRLERAEQNAESVIVTSDAPVGVPADFAEHVGIMFYLLAAAWQSDVTRVFAFMMARELSQRTYPELNCLDPHHAMSHHRNEPALMAGCARVSTFHASLFAKFVDKLQSTPDGDGSLLDHSLILYGSGMAKSNQHTHTDLPLVVVGGGSGTVKGNRHLRYSISTPIANLHVALGQKMGLEMNEFGHSNGVVEL
jgi:hypothetical protein